MAGKDDAEERKLPPSEIRLRRLRLEGTVPRSREFVSAVGMVALLLYFVAGSSYIISKFRDAMSLAFDNAEGLQAAFAQELPALARTAAAIFLPAGLILIIAMLLASTVAPGGFVLSSKALAASLSRLSPAEGFKKIFGLASMLDLAKSLARVVLIFIVFWILVRHFLNDIFWAPACGPECALQVFRAASAALLGAGAVIAMLVGLADLPMSHWLFRRDQRMSVTEKRREDREEFGHPELLRARRELRQVLAQPAIRGIENATLLLVSGKAAVGLAYIKDRTPAPYVVAKGFGAMSEDMRRQIVAKQLPVIEEVGLTERLLNAAPLGQIVPSSFFDEVAAVLVRNRLLG